MYTKRQIDSIQNSVGEVNDAMDVVRDSKARTQAGQEKKLKPLLYATEELVTELMDLMGLEYAEETECEILEEPA